MAALLLAQLSYGQDGIISLLNGILNAEFGAIWHFLAVAPIGIIYVAGAVACSMSRKEPLVLFNKSSPKALLVLALSQVWVVIAEEIGWRGFALPHLQVLLGWLGAGLVLGILWAAWHFPMFFVSGSNQYRSSFAKYVFIVTIWSLYMAMLYFRTGGSILSCMLFHASANLWGYTIKFPDNAERLELALQLPILLIAMVLLLA